MQSFKATMLAALLVLLTTPAPALVLPEIAEMTPHRAVYDITLGDAKSSAGVSDVKGRLVFEFTGSPCEGYAQTLRFVMSITDREGTTTLSDLRSTTWEDAESKSFKFDIENLENQETKEAATGTATRDAAGGIEVKLSKPAAAKATFPGPVLFPLQHTATLLAAAKRGEHRVDVGVFDGSELGQKVFTTGTAIGKPAIGDESELAGVANTERLQHQPSWPMTVAYFPSTTGGGEGTPEHEMSFRLYPNGVIRSVKIDYGTLRLDGRLSKIEFLDQKTCGG
ncbi:MAG: cell envelope integrity EipB family protein [Hyphomicrobiaceae bacterium]